MCLLAFILIALVLRGLRVRRVKARMDWLGAVLISLSLTALNIGVGGSSQETGAIQWIGARLAPTRRAVFDRGIGAVHLVLVAAGAPALSSGAATVIPPSQLFSRHDRKFFIGTSLFIAIAKRAIIH